MSLYDIWNWFIHTNIIVVILTLVVVFYSIVTIVLYTFGDEFDREGIQEKLGPVILVLMVVWVIYTIMSE